MHTDCAPNLFLGRNCAMPGQVSSSQLNINPKSIRTQPVISASEQAARSQLADYYHPQNVALWELVASLNITRRMSWAGQGNPSYQ